MRPEILNPLFAEAEALNGIALWGQGTGQARATRAIDLAFSFPTGRSRDCGEGAAGCSAIGSARTPFERRDGRCGPSGYLRATGDTHT